MNHLAFNDRDRLIPPPVVTVKLQHNKPDLTTGWIPWAGGEGYYVSHGYHASQDESNFWSPIDLEES